VVRPHDTAQRQLAHVLVKEEERGGVVLAEGVDHEGGDQPVGEEQAQEEDREHGQQEQDRHVGERLLRLGHQADHEPDPLAHHEHDEHEEGGERAGDQGVEEEGGGELDGHADEWDCGGI